MAAAVLPNHDFFGGGVNNEVTHTLIVIQLNCPKEGFFYLLFHGGYYHPKPPGHNQKCSLQRRQSDAAFDCGADFCFFLQFRRSDSQSQELNQPSWQAAA